MTEAVEKIEFLARSAHRIRILDLLREHGKLPNHELRDHFNASRTTVGRNLAALEDQGWIRRTNSTCEITRHGELVAEAFGDLVDTVEVTNSLESFMQWVPEGSLDLDLQHLADADIVLAKPGDPWAMVNRHVAAISETSDDQAMLPVTGLHAMEAIHRKIVSGDARTELVAEPSIVKTFQSNPDYAPLVEEMVDTGRFEIWLYNGDIPYYLGVLDSTVQIGVDEDGEPRAMVETDTEAVADWAVEVYESYKRDSEPVRLVQ
jgi:predicted transcriptional regulator